MVCEVNHALKKRIESKRLSHFVKSNIQEFCMKSYINTYMSARYQTKKVGNLNISRRISRNGIEL